MSRAGAASRAAIAALLVAAACGKPAPYTVRRPLPRGAEEGPPPSAAPELRVLVVADFGDPGRQQRAVAARMAKVAAERRFDLAFSIGDNLYECGADPRLPGAAACRFAPDGNTVVPGYAPPDDPRFATQLEDALRDLPPGLPVHAALGNHDVEEGCREAPLPPEELSRLRACLQVAHRSPRWAMPGRRYVVDRGPARFVVLDTNLLLRDYGGFRFEDEVAFVAEAARTAGDRLLFVVGHHPPATAGGHAGDHHEGYVARVRRIQEAADGRIVAWLAGHEHDLEHLRAAAGYDVVIAGGTSRSRALERFTRVEPAAAQLLFASTDWGFATLEVAKDHWAVRFENDAGEPLHCCHAVPPGRCRPVACPAPR